MESIKGNTLADGGYNLYLQAVDSQGNTSNVFEFAFTLDTTTPPISNNSEFAIKTEGVLTINGGGDLDGELSNLDDDTLVYAAKGFKLNGNFELPVKLNPNGTPQLDNSGKKILRDNAVDVANGYTSSRGPNNQYAGLQPPQVIEEVTVNIPAYSDLKQQKLDSFVPNNSQTITFDISDNNNTLGNGNWHWEDSDNNSTLGNGNWNFGDNNSTIGNGNFNFGNNNTVIGNGNWVYTDNSIVIGNGNWSVIIDKSEAGAEEFLEDFNATMDYGAGVKSATDELVDGMLGKMAGMLSSLTGDLGESAMNTFNQLFNA